MRSSLIDEGSGEEMHHYHYRSRLDCHKEVRGPAFRYRRLDYMKGTLEHVGIDDDHDLNLLIPIVDNVGAVQSVLARRGVRVDH